MQRAHLAPPSRLGVFCGRKETHHGRVRGWGQPSQAQRQVTLLGSPAAQGPEVWMLLMRTKQERPALANKPRLESENSGQQRQALGRAGSHGGQIRFKGPAGWGWGMSGGRVGGGGGGGELQEVKAWKQKT